MRIKWIDNLKFMGIYLVVLGHLDISQTILNYIYSFHMPLFFFISGYLFNISYYKNYFDFLKKKFKIIIIPYFIFSIISYILWILILRKVGSNINEEINILKPLIGIVYSVGIENWMVHNIPMWFLTCLFILENYFYFLASFSISRLILSMIILAILGGISVKLGTHLPWGIDVSLTAGTFFSVGYIIRKLNLINEFKCINIKQVILSMICIIIGVISSTKNGPIGMSGNYYGNLNLFYLSAFSSILGYILIMPNNITFKFINYISNNTIIILALHLMIIAFIKLVCKILGIYLNGVFLENIIIALLTILVSIIPIFIINNFFPWIIGRNKIKY